MSGRRRVGDSGPTSTACSTSSAQAAELAANEVATIMTAGGRTARFAMQPCSTSATRTSTTSTAWSPPGRPSGARLSGSRGRTRRRTPGVAVARPPRESINYTTGSGRLIGFTHATCPWAVGVASTVEGLFWRALGPLGLRASDARAAVQSDEVGEAHRGEDELEIVRRLSRSTPWSFGSELMTQGRRLPSRGGS